MVLSKAFLAATNLASYMAPKVHTQIHTTNYECKRKHTHLELDGCLGGGGFIQSFPGSGQFRIIDGAQSRVKFLEFGCQRRDDSLKPFVVCFQESDALDVSSEPCGWEIQLVLYIRHHGDNDNS